MDVDVLSSPKFAEPDICDAELKKRHEKNDEKENFEDTAEKPVEYVPAIKWPDLIVQIFIHAGFIYGFGLVLTKAKFLTFLWGT